MEEFNTKLFISLIRSRSSIWDYKSAEFKDKMRKHKDWLAISEGIIPSFGEKSSKEKKLIVLRLQAKWKALRDGFVRNLRNRSKKSGPGAVYAKKYTHHDQMLFLIGKCKRDLTAWASNVQTKTPDVKDSDSDDSASVKDVITEPLANKPTETFVDADADKHFFLSLLKDFTRIADDYKLDAKGDIITVIRHYVNKSNQGVNQSPLDLFRGCPPQCTRTDVQNYTPEEISVKVSDKYVVIGGKHEDERGFVSREFKRRYFLPEDCEPGNVESRLSDGVLTVVAGRATEKEVLDGTVPIAIKVEDVELESRNEETQSENDDN